MMNQVRDEYYTYEAGGEMARCRLQVYRGGRGAVVVVATALPAQAGPGITAWATKLAEMIWREEGSPPVFTWVEHYPAAPAPGLGESFTLVQFAQGATGGFTTPRWRPVTPAVLAELLAADEVSTDWRSLPLRRVLLDCGQCGQPLAISTMLAGERTCTACTSGAVPPAATVPTIPDDLDHGRTAWLERTNQHEVRLGLTRVQRAALRLALVGGRSLWSLSPRELDTLVLRLEEFSSAAAVQAFLMEQGMDPDPPSPEE